MRRTLKIVGLVALGTYFAVCASFTLGRATPPDWIPARALWLGSWEMFTLLDDGSHAIEARAYVDGAFQPVELDWLFPTQWESGSRWQRSAHRSRPIAEVMCHAICERHPDDPDAIELSVARWTRTRGLLETEPAANASREVLMIWRCAETPALPVVLE